METFRNEAGENISIELITVRGTDVYIVLENGSETEHRRKKGTFKTIADFAIANLIIDEAVV